MALDNNKKILLYGFDEESKVLIEEIADENELPEFSVVDRCMSQMKIKDIIEGLNFKVIDNNLPDEKVVLFNNLTDDELERAIKGIRNKFKESPILAVITPTSIEWTLEVLINHLIEERNWFKEHRR